MKTQLTLSAALLAPAFLALMPAANAAIIGTTGTTGGACPANTRCFALTARAGYIATGDGNSLLVWGYSDDDHPITSVDVNGQAATLVQYPGPTLIANQDDTIQVTLRNALPNYPAGATASPPVSIVFPGQIGVTATGGSPGSPGLMTQETVRGAPAVVYRFKVNKPGTYLYNSGTQPELQIEMGLAGALIVRPSDFTTNKTAYGGAGSAYDREYLFFLTEMDRNAHELVDQGLQVRPAEFKETLWFLNGRNGPDTMLLPQVGHMPSQPYNALVRQEPHERTLMRIIGAGRDLHPFHHHGNNAWLIAHDGRLLASAATATAPYPDKPSTVLPDQAISNFTIQTVPGNTYDAIWTWTGKGLNWDIYGDRDGHKPGSGCIAANLVTGEDPVDHCKPIPVTLPEQQQLAFGGFWSGSPYLGSGNPLPPLQGGLNPSSGYTFMWHSHTERELTNDDIFPGGMMTMMIVEAPGTLDPE